MNAADLARAKQIAADLKRMSPESNMIEIVCRLLDEYEMQAKQITTLKAALCKERNRYLVDFIYEYDILDCELEAKDQLARELPEIDWSDMQ